MTSTTAPNEAQRQLLTRFLDELEIWNRRINLTSIERGEWWRRHIDESVELSALIAPSAAARIVDVGAGGGVPGIPLAVLRPDTHVSLIESDIRKAGFLTHLAGALELGNVSVIAERAEVAGRDEAHREAHDIAVSRATAALPVLCEFCLPLLKVGGALYAMVRDAHADARAAAGASALLGGAAPVAVTGAVVRVEKLTATPDVYPRRVGVPLKRPLA